MISSYKYFYHITFGVALLCIYFVCGVFDALPLPPQSIHLWAQSDRASVAALYYYESMDFFHPRTYNLLNGTGYTGMEFPLINFTAACLYKVFGFNQFWYRFLVMCIVTSGAFAAFKIAHDMLSNKTLAVCLTLLWLISPVILFYTPNFLADAASMGFIMISWYAFFRLMKQFSIGWLLMLLFFGACASLVKVTSSISILCMLGLLIADYLKWLSLQRETVFQKKHWLILSISIILLATASWYQYANYLNEVNFSETFHLGISPPESLDDALTILKTFPDYFLYHYYSPANLILILLFILLLIVFYRKNDRLLGLLLMGMGAANGSFIYLQLQKYAPHDYYMLTILPWVFFLFLAIGKAIEKELTTHRRIRIVFTLVFGLLIYNTAYSKRILSNRYDKNNLNYYNANFQAFYDIKPLMRQKGIERTDTIITMVDYTPNLSLYLMDQKGYSLSEIHYDPSLLFLIEERNAKYLVCNREDFIPGPFLKKVLGEPILQHDNIKVYKPIRSPLIRNLMDSVLDERFVLPYQIMKETWYWNENIKNVAAYLHLPVRTIERLNALKWFQVIDKDLNNRFEAYKQHHSGDEHVIRANFAIDEKLTIEEKYVWGNSHNTWFLNLEHRLE